jgi:hypothetical protein
MQEINIIAINKTLSNNMLERLSSNNCVVFSNYCAKQKDVAQVEKEKNSVTANLRRSALRI